jgi:fermentation-respiration switch protein FrsA (DUF1100 family)
MARTMTTIAIALVAGWLIVVGALYLFQRSLIYLPDRSRPDPAWLKGTGFAEIVARTEDGLALTAWFHPPAAPTRLTVALFHGNGGHHAYRLPTVLPLARAGYGVLLASYRGYAGNPGAPSEEGFAADARAWMAALAARAIAADRVVLWGESLGGGVATGLALETRVAAVILSAPFTSIADRAQELYPFAPARLLVKDRFDNLSRIAEIGAPLFIVHGERDRVVPVEHGRRLFAAAREPKRSAFIPEADHNDLGVHGLVDHVLLFLRQVSG